MHNHIGFVSFVYSITLVVYLSWYKLKDYAYNHIRHVVGDSKVSLQTAPDH